MLQNILARCPVSSIADAIQVMIDIDLVLADNDGLKWFNRLYLETTRAVEAEVLNGSFHDTAWLSQLDVLFANLYFEAPGRRTRRGASAGGMASAPGGTESRGH